MFYFSVESLLGKFLNQGEINIPESYNSKIDRETVKDQLVILNKLKRKLQQGEGSVLVRIQNNEAETTEVNKNSGSPQRKLPAWINTKQDNSRDSKVKTETIRKVVSPARNKINSPQNSEGTSSKQPDNTLHRFFGTETTVRQAIDNRAPESKTPSLKASDQSSSKAAGHCSDDTDNKR